MNHGECTARLGRMLERRIADLRHSLRVVYDHAEETEHRIVSFVGQSSSRETSLSHVDIAIISEESDRAILLCEIEEKESEPKRIIGNLGAILLADYVSIAGKKYRIEGTQFVLGLKTHPRGMGKEKAETIQRLMTSRLKGEAPERIKIKVVCDEDRDGLLETVSTEIIRLLTSVGA